MLFSLAYSAQQWAAACPRPPGCVTRKGDPWVVEFFTEHFTSPSDSVDMEESK